MSHMIRRELYPGVWLRTIHTAKFKSAFLSLTLLAPLQAEHASANALVPQVLRRGTRRYPDMMRLSAALDSLYGGAIEPVIRKKGETQCVGFRASFLDDAYTLAGERILEPAAALLGELLLDPCTEHGVFPAACTAREAENQLSRILGQINDKRSYATQRLTQLMCEEEAFGVARLGDPESTRAITPASLWERYQALLGTARLEIYYCGCAEPQRVEDAIRAALAALPVRENRVHPPCDTRPSPGHAPVLVTETMDVTQGKLAMGLRTGGICCRTEDYPALLLCNAIFGGSTLSKLFLNVREKRSLAYYASSTLQRLKGLILVSSGIDSARFEAARQEILEQLEAIRRGEITDRELEGARRTLIGSQLAALDDPFRQEDFWLGQAVAGLDTDIPAMVTRLEAVTREQVTAAARRLQLDTTYFLRGKE